jgi:hypothetical protein
MTVNNQTEPERSDGLHCVYGNCRGFPNSPYPCHPGCYFQMTATSELELLRRAIAKSAGDCK